MSPSSTTRLGASHALVLLACAMLSSLAGAQEVSPVEDSPIRGYFLFDQTQLSGSYRVKFGPPLATEALFAVNVDPKESDLTKLQPEELRAMLPGWRFTYLTNWQAIATGKSSVTQNRGELHHYLLYAALLLVFVESLLAWKFGHYG